MARLPVHRKRRAGQQIPAPEAHLEESVAVEPAGRPERAAQRSAAERMRAGRGPELAQDAQRQLALHARPQRPARDAALDARRARRRQPLLDVLDHRAP